MERNSSGNFVLQEKVGPVGRRGDPVFGVSSFANKLPQPIDKDEISAFRKGKKEILVFTTAFSTGISLHADPKYPNIKQRVFIPLELPYAVDQLFQQVGRTSRTNQVHAAEIVILGTHLAGETRFLNAVASKATSRKLAKQERFGSGYETDKRETFCLFQLEL